MEPSPNNGTAPPPLDYELLDDDYPNYDLSFKVIVIGNSGMMNKKYKKNRCWKILFIHKSN